MLPLASTVELAVDLLKGAPEHNVSAILKIAKLALSKPLPSSWKIKISLYMHSN